MCCVRTVCCVVGPEAPVEPTAANAWPQNWQTAAADRLAVRRALRVSSAGGVSGGGCWAGSGERVPLPRGKSPLNTDSQACSASEPLDGARTRSEAGGGRPWPVRRMLSSSSLLSERCGRWRSSKSWIIKWGKPITTTMSDFKMIRYLLRNSPPEEAANVLHGSVLPSRGVRVLPSQGNRPRLGRSGP